MLQVLFGGPQNVLDFLAVDLDERHVHLVHPTLVFHLLLRLGDLSDRVGVGVRVIGLGLRLGLGLGLTLTPSLYYLLEVAAVRDEDEEERDKDAVVDEPASHQPGN